MQITSLALLLGLISAVNFGLADFLAAKASKRLGPITTALCMQLAATCLYVLYYVLFVHRMPTLAPHLAVITMVSAVLIAWGSCVLYRAFEIGPVSLASPLSAAYPLVAAVVGVVFFQSHLNTWQILGIGLLVAGIMAVSGIFSTRQWRLGPGPRLALVATLVWGIGYPLLGTAIAAADWRTITLVQMVCMLAVMVVALFIQSDHERIEAAVLHRALRSPFTLGAGCTMVVAELCINISFDYGQVAGALVVAISSAYPALTIMLALRHFKEQVAFASLAGVGATIGGAVLLLLG